ncbi:hypothetical protein SAMN02745111_02348 [Eubacterium uniforme]|uniref:DUF5050 domain-containing protein n=1 Tax=Eubacterium uniforme TaxID=39495 RepID=A0A1T4W596_9FIRM|nr:hypothetical protein [Eubacterium uniforme]SKA72403.1 hypothetical protein SAMN02745111_02348 [Eubacterium uniforme]
MRSLKRIKYVVILAIATLSLTSCDNKKSVDKIAKKTGVDSFNYDNYMESIEEYKYFKERVLKANEVLVFNISKNNLGLYNTGTKTWKEIYDSAKNNLFAYNVKGQEQSNVFYTIGSTSYNDFSVVKYNKENSMIESVMDVNESDSVIPIGMYDEKMYFIHNKNDLEDNETRSIAYLDDDKLVNIIDFKNELVTNAVIIKDDIYCAAYSEENEINNIYCCSIKNHDIKNVLQSPYDNIFRYKDELVYVNKNMELVNIENKKYYKLEDNDTIDVLSDYGLLIRSYIGDDKNIACDVVDINDGSVIETASKFDGYNLNDGILELYCEGNIKNIDVERGK